MHYSFSTVYMAIIASNILLILLTLCFRNKKLMINTGYKLLALFVVFTLIRCLLPFEMSFTKTILLPKWISAVITLIRHPLFYIGEYEFSAWTVLQGIWLIGFVVKLVQYIRTQAKSRYYILSHMWDVTANERYQSILTKVCAEKGKRNSFQIVEVAGLKIPLLYGIFKPLIMLPKGHTLSDEDLYYIFAHEASHHFHHDLVTKNIIHFIDMIYWWNPFCRTLVKQTDVILEMRIDDVITISDTHTIKRYLRCLIRLAEHAANNPPVSLNVCMPLLILTDKKSDGDMTKRFQMMATSSAKKKHSLNLVLLLSVICIYLSSYAFIWEAHYTPPEVEESTLAPSDDGFYAILKEDNTYDIYYNDLFMENTDALKYYQGIQVYTEKEFYDEEP